MVFVHDINSGVLHTIVDDACHVWNGLFDVNFGVGVRVFGFCWKRTDRSVRVYGQQTARRSKALQRGAELLFNTTASEHERHAEQW